MPGGILVRKTIIASTGPSSMRLEPELWDALAEICKRERTDLRQFIRKVDCDGGGDNHRTSTIRVQIVRYFRHAATEPGHLLAGHGTLAALAEGKRP